MKQVVIVSNKFDDYNDMVEFLKKELSNNVEIKNIESKEGLDLTNIIADIIIYEVTSVDEIEGIEALEIKIPFIIATNHKSMTCSYKIYKSGAVDCIFKPFDSYIIAKKVLRYLLNIDSIQEVAVSRESIEFDIETIISKDLKGAKRGNHPYSIIAVRCENNLKEIKNLLQKNLRETDTVLQYAENILMISLPYCDVDGSLVVKNKLTKSILDKLNLNINMSSVTLIDMKQEKDELIEAVLKN